LHKFIQSYSLRYDRLINNVKVYYQMPFYAVKNGRSTGIFLTWKECELSIKGYANAAFKKFDSKEDAENYIQMNEDMTIVTLDVANDDGGEDEFHPLYYVYTDGACSNNGRHGAKAGIGVFFGANDSRNISRRVEGRQTNNVAELSAIIEAYYAIEKDAVLGEKIAIVTDSQYAIRCIGSYGEKCCMKAWNVDIPNKELVQLAYHLYKEKTNVRLIHIKAHTNKTDIHSIGNKNADRLANAAINT